MFGFVKTKKLNRVFEPLVWNSCSQSYLSDPNFLAVKSVHLHHKSATMGGGKLPSHIPRAQQCKAHECIEFTLLNEKNRNASVEDFILS